MISFEDYVARLPWRDRMYYRYWIRPTTAVWALLYRRGLIR